MCRMCSVSMSQMRLRFTRCRTPEMLQLPAFAGRPTVLAPRDRRKILGSSLLPPTLLHERDPVGRGEVVQPCRLTISLIQIGAKGDVQPLETG